MLQRMSDQYKIKFLDKENEVNTEGKSNREKAADYYLKEALDTQKEKKLSNIDDGYKTDKHICSATSGVIRDDCGSYSYLKNSNVNSIFNPNKIDEVIKTEDNKTRTIKEHEEINNSRADEKQKRADELVNLLKSTDQTKGNAVSLNGLFSGSSYRMPKNNISIFDQEDFERVGLKTEGEVVSEETEKRSGLKDESWKDGKTTVSSKDLSSRLFDNLFSKDE